MALESRRRSVPSVPGFFRPRAEGPASPLCVLILAVLVCVLVVSGWRVQVAHRARVRGLPPAFPAPISDADVPPLGVNVALDAYDEQELTSVLTTISDGGFVWVRQTFRWSEIRAKGASGTYDWSDADRVVHAVSQHPRLRLVAVLDDEPAMPPEDTAAFAVFARAFAERYGDWVDHYQIWDEPNLAAGWRGAGVNPAGYANLLARSAEAIRIADPQARILLAGLAPTTETGPQNLSEPRFLERLYEAGAAPFFDIVAAKPYGFDTGPGDRRVDESVLNVSRVILLREVMARHGDADKAIWASHWGWNALPAGWTGAPSIWGQTDAESQAERSVALLDRAREEWPWMGAMIIENLQPEPSSGVNGLEDSRWGFALLASDGSPRPLYDRIADWAASLPDAAPVGGYAAVNPWTTYGDGWRTGPVGADPPTPGSRNEGEDVGTFRFDGTRAALTVRRGPYRGFLYLTVDGRPANGLPRDEEGRTYVVLYGRAERRDTVPFVSGLDPGVHVVDVKAEGGHGQWPIVGWRVGTDPVRDGARLKMAGLGTGAALMVILLALKARRVDWRAAADGLLGRPPLVQVAMVAVTTAVFWASSGLSWGQVLAGVSVNDLCLVVSAVALPVLTFLFAVRLDLGLALIAFSAPFYLVPDRMFYRALSLPEVLVILCLAGAAVNHWLLDLRLVPYNSRLPDGGRSRGPEVWFSVIDAGVVAMILAACLSSTTARDKVAALFELRSVFLIPTAYYALVRLAALDERVRQRVVDGFLVGAAGVAVVGLAQVGLGRNLVAAEGGLRRLQSVYHSPNNLGLYLGRAWPFLAVGAVWGHDGWRRSLSLVGLGLITAAVGLSFSRGAILLGLPASILVMGWWSGGRHRWYALGLVGVWALILVPVMRTARFAALFNLGEGTTFLRLKLWESSLRMIREHPVLGIGPGNFLEAYRTRYILPAAWEEFNLEHAHNVLLDHWTHLGMLGVAAGVVAQVGFWRAVRRWRCGLALGLVGSMAAALAHGLVDNAFFFPDLALVSALTLALAQRRSR